MSEPGRDAGPSASRARVGRRTVLAVALWAVAATVAVLVAWRAVAAVDADSPRTGVLSASDVTAELADARAAATATATTTPSASPTPSLSAGPDPAPSASAVPTPASPSDPTQPAAVDPAVRSWSVTGGTVAATCAGAAAGLLYATPSDGWGVEVGSSGPEHVEVTFSREGAESKVEVRCEAGVPVQSVEERSEDQRSQDDD
ncbi:hypothetical protein ACTHAM_001073 [Cellulomonas soli]|uniref:hypothetical protein n=1 Tax=Cellulomonas soli TaxID=931535 RepID=UPI003F83A7B8